MNLARAGQRVSASSSLRSCAAGSIEPYFRIGDFACQRRHAHAWRKPNYKRRYYDVTGNEDEAEVARATGEHIQWNYPPMEVARLVFDKEHNWGERFTVEELVKRNRQWMAEATTHTVPTDINQKRSRYWVIGTDNMALHYLPKNPRLHFEANWYIRPYAGAPRSSTWWPGVWANTVLRSMAIQGFGLAFVLYALALRDQEKRPATVGKNVVLCPPEERIVFRERLEKLAKNNMEAATLLGQIYLYDEGKKREAEGFQLLEGAHLASRGFAPEELKRYVNFSESDRSNLFLPASTAYAEALDEKAYEYDSDGNDSEAQNTRLKAREAMEFAAFTLSDPHAYYLLAFNEMNQQQLGYSRTWLDYITKAAASGHEDAIIELAEFYSKSVEEIEALDSNPKFARREGGAIQELKYLQGIKYNNDDIHESFDGHTGMALEWNEVATMAGNILAAYRLGDMYLRYGSSTKARQIFKDALVSCYIPPEEAVAIRAKFQKAIQQAAAKEKGSRIGDTKDVVGTKPTTTAGSLQPLTSNNSSSTRDSSPGTSPTKRRGLLPRAK